MNGLIEGRVVHYVAYNGRHLAAIVVGITDVVNADLAVFTSVLNYNKEKNFGLQFQQNVPYSEETYKAGPIATAIKNLIVAQIPSINQNNIYIFLPDRPPTDGSVLLPLVRMKLLHNYSGKVQYQLTYTMWHVFRRRSMSDTLASAYTYITPWLKFLEAWPNQTLGGLAEEVTATDVTITQKVDNGQPFVYLICTFYVVTTINIPTS